MTGPNRLIGVAALVLLAACSRGSSRGGGGGFASTAPGSTAAISSPASVVLLFDAAVPSQVRTRIENLVRSSSPTRPVMITSATATVGPLGSGSLVLSFGETTATRALIPSAETASLPGEGFILRSSSRDGVTTLATDGRPPVPDVHKLGVNAGLVYGCYALLEEVGFAFLHPLAPTAPPELVTPRTVDRRESPRWGFRGIHLHTMHPLELTELLNGWGKNGPRDDQGWRDMLPEWETFLEWCVANRQNRVEWFLLIADSWRTFGESATRQARLAELVSRAHAWGVAAGADVPLALRQQHAWYMVEKTGTLAQEEAQIRARLDWLNRCGFAFYATELGTSEFTSTNDVRMLAWLDCYATYAKSQGKSSYAKIHCSTGQVAKSFKDPVTGGDLNYNHLPRLADPALGVYPHTVQHYGLDDPAPTYSNTDFDYVRKFAREEAGAREVVWHPETAYWVSFDNDVPLFLPVYAERRLHDLRLLAKDETAGLMGRGPNAGAKMTGQMFFSSGWEWGYWLNDVVCARAAWNPEESAATDEEALRRVLEPLVRACGAAGSDLRDAIVETARTQHELLIEGRVNGVKPAKIEKRNAQAYLQGWEAWDDVSSDLSRIGAPLHPTQPLKLGMIEMRGPLAFLFPDYAKEIRPLLEETDRRLADHAAGFARLRASAPASAAPLVDDLADSARITSLRAKQVLGLYEWSATRARPKLDGARAALDEAAKIVATREQAYRVPADRIAGWRENPTAYAFTYLWTVRSLHYWWRDEIKAVDAPASPFAENIIDPLDIALGEGFWIPLAQLARDWGNKFGIGFVTNGLAAPTAEPRYPANGLRQRP